MFLSLLFEGGLYLLPVLLIFYFAYHKPVIESVGIFIWCLIANQSNYDCCISKNRTLFYVNL